MSNEKLQSKRILVVEDDELSQFLLKKVLQSIGIQVDYCDNGKAALDCIQESKYDLLLMDIEMPIMNGIQATLEIRKLPELYYQNLPIIGLSANPFDISVEKYLADGMNDYLTKPINESVLLQKIAFYLLAE